MKVLVNCECSGAVRRALTALGHKAVSCDLEPAEDGSPDHIQGDAIEAAYGRQWDLMIAHPPCTFLANSGAKHLYVGMSKANGENPDRWNAMLAAAEFYAKLWQAPIERIALENPIMVGAARDIIQSIAPDHPVKRQFVQPWMFGHKEIKATGWALKNLPYLVPTNDVRAETMRLSYAERAKVHHMAPGPNRARERSRTLPGCAAAYADQWTRGSWAKKYNG